MRTYDEIVEYYKEHKEDDFLGFIGQAMLMYLPFKYAKQFLIPDANEEEWNKGVEELTEENVLKQMREYMEFAWGKVQDHRGISAGRSVEKMEAWLRILGDDETADEIKKDSNYPQYGAPALKIVCDKYGFPVPADERVENMIEGRPCHVGCEEGCGRGIG